MELLLVLPQFGHWVSDINWSNTETAYQVQVDVIWTEKRLNSSATPSFLQKFMQINNKGTYRKISNINHTSVGK